MSGFLDARLLVDCCLARNLLASRQLHDIYLEKTSHGFGGLKSIFGGTGHIPLRKGSFFLYFSTKQNNTRKILVPRSRNITGVSGLALVFDDK